MTVLVINGKTIKPQKGKTAKIKINKNDQVELLDDNGNFSQSLTMQESGEDLIIYGENGQPEFVLVQYQNAPELAALVPPAGEAVATSEAVLASQTGISKSTMVLGGLLALAAGGVAAGAGGGGSSSGDKPKVDPNNPDNYLPSLKLGKSEVSIKENQKGEIITTVKADDADGDQVSYSVNDSRFEIDSKGNLKLKAGNALDFEKEKTINLTITAKDAKGGTTTKNLKINVQDDVSDNPNSVPELTLGKDEVLIKENVSGATITSVKATDKDGDKITYSVNDNRFEVDNKGNLKLKSGQFLDYEKEKAVNVTVTAQDAKGASVSKTVKINVENVNEKPDLDVGKSEVTVKENVYGATITSVSFKDPDGDKPSYTVSDDRFEVVSGNLKLKSGVALDYEKEKTVTVKITAKDGKGLEDSETVKINVSNDTSDDTVKLPDIKLSYSNGKFGVENMQLGAFEYSVDGGKTWVKDNFKENGDMRPTKNADGTYNTQKLPVKEVFEDDQKTLEPENFQIVVRQGDRKSNTVTINNFDAKTDVEIDSTTYADGKVT
ncbi:MAG: cadherin repeat domain-containing protein, partial [Neisseriaceae bacterium]|nr:cadherin repeat domain-containing protein [Neisseriaceae bacterium]